MRISDSPSVLNFKAKFLYSDALNDVVQYSIQKNKSEALNTARKNVDKTFLRTRLLFDYGINEKGLPFVSFTRFVPKNHITVPQSLEDYNQYKPTVYTSSDKKINPLAFALKQLIKLGNGVPESKMYKAVVIGK